MSDDNVIDDGGNGIADLRKQYEAQKKELAEARKALDEFNKAKRTESVAELLKAKGVPASAAKFYTDDDVSEGAVGKWIEDNKDVFGAPASVQDDGSNSEPDANAVAAQRVTAASFGNSTNVTPSGDGSFKGDYAEALRIMQDRSITHEQLRKMGLVAPAGSSAFAKK